MVILVDMDDTIELLLKAWVGGVNEKYSRSVTVDEIVSWDVSAAFPGLSREQVYDITMQPGFWNKVEPMEGAPGALKRLMDKGHEVYIVTATPFESVHEKMRDVLFRYFPFIERDHVIIACRKQMIRGDVLIDDGIHNLEGGQYKKILMTAPHNASYDAEANGMYRVGSWEEAERVIASFER